MSLLGCWKDGMSWWVCSEKPVTSRPSLEQAAHHLFEKWLKREGPSNFPALVLGLGEGAVPPVFRVVRGSSVGRWGPQDKG